MSIVLGHERQIKYLEKVLSNGRFAHAYLFSGPEGVGKFTIARNFSKLFYCNQMLQVNSDRFLTATFDKICNVCSDCILIERGLHSQVVILDPENTLVSKKDTRKEIPIGDIRELKRRLALAPAGEQWRVVIINQADKISKEAEAAFLKLLEEPGSRVLFILVSASKDDLSQTIVSRTQVVNFSLVPEKILSPFLHDKIKDSRLINEILELAGGRAGKIFALLEDKDKLKKEREFFDEIEALCEKADLAGAFHLSEKSAAEDEFRQKIPAYLILALRKKLLKNGAVFSQKADLIKSIKKTQRIWQIMETTNVNPRLALDAMFIETFNSYGL